MSNAPTESNLQVIDHTQNISNTLANQGRGQVSRHVSKSSARPSPKFKKFRDSHMEKIRLYNNANKRTETVFLNAGIMEQTQIVYGDSYGIKKTNFFRSEFLKSRLHSLKKQSFHIHRLTTQTVSFELWLTPENQVDRRIIKTVSL